MNWARIRPKAMARQDLALEQKILRALKPLKNRPTRLILAVSGGVDSMVMAEILWKWRIGLGVDLAVAHVHHGPTSSLEQRRYRAKAQKFVAQWAKTRQLPFFTNPVMDKGVGEKPASHSEQDLRRWREKWLRQWLTEWGGEALVLAHHQDDLLETRLLRLIRGSGSQGLRSMSILHGDKFRPLLALSSREVRAYARYRSLRWLEDPSNQKLDALRNWVRHEWLPSLEKKRPGAMNALSRSLETLAPEVRDFDLAPFVGLRRELLSHVSDSKQRELVAQYLRALGHFNYEQTHVIEIVKRLSTKRKNVEFEILGLRFQISPDFLWASRV